MGLRALERVAPQGFFLSADVFERRASGGDRLFQLFQLRCASVTAPPSCTRTARSDCGAPHAASIFAMAAAGKRLSSGATLAAVTSCTLPCGPSGTSVGVKTDGSGLSSGSRTKRPFLSPLMIPCSASSKEVRSG